MPRFKNVIIGTETSEDAGAYRIYDNLAIVQTADFITPVVDDPYVYGQIAAANSLSDIYAMGAKPITAINLLMFASCKVPHDYVKPILQGGADKTREAGASLLGGHSVDDLETKYGLSVTGTVEIDKIVRNSTAKVGDVLVYTKPIGIGVLTTAIKADMASPKAIESVSEVMTTLNKAASEAMVEVGVDACTDVTGFGFLGHSYEMAKYSGVGMEIDIDSFTVLDESREFASMGLFPAITYDNIDYVSKHVIFDKKIDEDTQRLLFDPQTSGGLLISVPKEKVDVLMSKLKEKGVKWAQIVGRVNDEAGMIRVS